MADNTESAKKELSIARGVAPIIAVMATLIYASSLAKNAPVAPNIFQFDKIAHFFVFGLFGTLWFRMLRIPFLDTKRWMVAFMLVLLLGVVDEILQYFNPNRSFDPYDWVADASGALVAIFVYRGWTWYRRMLETPVLRLLRFQIVEDTMAYRG